MRSFDAGKNHMIHTRYGTISVTVQGASDRTPLLTFPEVGLNHTQCFQPLLSAAADRPLFLDNFCILHIDPPGTGAGLEEVGKELRTEPSIDAYVDMVHIVLSHFQVKEALGMGVGVGGYVMARAALSKPSIFIGLVLASPPFEGPTVYERVVSQGCLWTSALPEHIISRTLGSYAQSTDLSIVLRQELRGMQKDGIVAYLKAALTRTPILADLKTLKCRVLLVGGEHSLYRDDLWKATLAF